MFQERIDASDTTVGMLTLSPAVLARLQDNPDGQELMKVVAACIGTAEGRNFLAAAMGADSAEFGTLAASASSAGGQGATVAGAAVAASPVQEGCQVTYEHKARTFSMPQDMPTLSQSVTNRSLRVELLGELAAPTSGRIQAGSQMRQIT